jgi:toxin ParE1/3/4
MQIRLSQEANREYDEAWRYYEEQVPGLGEALREDIQSAMRRIRTWPLSAPVEEGEIRRALLSRFPYKLLYSIESDHLYIIAVAHLHRRPRYWHGNWRNDDG